MRRFLGRLTWVALAAAGIAAIAGYASIVLTNDDAQTRSDAGLLAGVGVTALITAVCVRLVLRGGGHVLRFPPLWLGPVAFLAAIVLGWIAARSDRWPAFDPALALVAIGATFAIIAAIVTRWSPGKSVARRIVLGPVAWGMLGAPAVALVIELACAVALFAGGLLGLYLADPDLLRRVREQGIESIVESSGNNLITTPTVILGIYALYAVLAPLAEEFAKLVGSLIFLPRLAPTRFDALTCGAFAGLGFASFETLLYALAAGDQWPLLAALRAPVALIHVAAAMTAAGGWFAVRTRGSGIAGGYALAVLIHGLWNGLTISVLVISASVDDPEQLSPLLALTTLAIFGLMATLLVGCATWIVVAARRYGRSSSDREPPAMAGRPIDPSLVTERSATITGATLGSA